MTKPPKTYEVESSYHGLNKILMGTIQELKRGDLDQKLEMASVVSQIADKIIKNNLTAILDKKRRNDDSPLSFFENVESTTLLTGLK